MCPRPLPRQSWIQPQIDLRFPGWGRLRRPHPLFVDGLFLGNRHSLPALADPMRHQPDSLTCSLRRSELMGRMLEVSFFAQTSAPPK